MEVTRMFDPRDEKDSSLWDNEAATLKDIQKFMFTNDIPENAVIRYAGCGTHRIEFAWDDPTDGGSTIR